MNQPTTLPEGMDNIGPEVLELVPETMAALYNLMPISKVGNELLLASLDTNTDEVRDALESDLRSFLGYNISITRDVTRAELDALLAHYYPQ